MKKILIFVIFIAVIFSLYILNISKEILDSYSNYVDIAENVIMSRDATIDKYRVILVQVRLDNVTTSLAVLSLYVQDNNIAFDNLWRKAVSDIVNISQDIKITSFETDGNYDDCDVDCKIALSNLEYDNLSVEQRKEVLIKLTMMLTKLKKAFAFDESVMLLLNE